MSKGSCKTNEIIYGLVLFVFICFRASAVATCRTADAEDIKIEESPLPPILEDTAKKTTAVPATAQPDTDAVTIKEDQLIAGIDTDYENLYSPGEPQSTPDFEYR